MQEEVNDTVGKAASEEYFLEDMFPPVDACLHTHWFWL